MSRACSPWLWPEHKTGRSARATRPVRVPLIGGGEVAGEPAYADRRLRAQTIRAVIDQRFKGSSSNAGYTFLKTPTPHPS
jgi:hypothetical protein